MINKPLIAQRFSKALPTYNQQASVQQAICQQLIALLSSTKRSKFQRILEIGCGTGQLTTLLHQYCCADGWHLNDLCDTRPHLTPLLQQTAYQFFQGDAEQLTFSGQYDLLASASTVQWFENPKGFLAKCSTLLAPQGLLLISTFAPQNLIEIKKLTGIGLHYPSLKQWETWLTPQFEILHLSQQTLHLSFDSPLDVLRHLKSTGVTAVGTTLWNKKRLQQFIDQYQQQYCLDNHQVQLTYQPIFILARKKEGE